MHVFSAARLTRQLSWVAIIAMVVSMMVPFLASSNLAYADTVTARTIDLQTSEPGAAGSYDISFTVPDTGAENIGAFRVEFCDNDPLPYTACTFTSGDNVPDLDATDAEGSAAASLNGTPSFDGETISMAAPALNDNFLTFTLASDTDPAADTVFSVTVDDVNNPTNTTDTNNNNAFYARVYVYSDNVPTAYANPIVEIAENIHDGGIAMSTAQVITLDARVQETLNFCVGTLITTTGDCSTISGNAIDLGVLSQTAPTESYDVDAGGTPDVCDLTATPECAVLVVSTNATNAGVDVDYITKSGFQVGTGVCDSGTAADAAETDQCLNPAGTAAVDEGTEQTISAGDEAWGQAVVSTAAHASSGTTNNLVSRIDADYDFGSTGWAIEDSGLSVDLADSNAGTAATNVVDREQLEIGFAASSAITTPAGAYQVQIVYIATGTF